jgi:hypothetical protein
MVTQIPYNQTGTGIGNIVNFIGNSPYIIQLIIVGGIVVTVFIAILTLRKRGKI